MRSWRVVCFSGGRARSAAHRTRVRARLAPGEARRSRAVPLPADDRTATTRRHLQVRDQRRHPQRHCRRPAGPLLPGARAGHPLAADRLDRRRTFPALASVPQQDGDGDVWRTI